MMKTQAQLNAQHKISSIVQNAAADALATAATLRSTGGAAHIQSGHQAIKEQMARAAAQAQQVAQAAASTSGVANDTTASVLPPPRTQADILKENLHNIKDEVNDSDCELVETDAEHVSVGERTYP